MNYEKLIRMSRNEVAALVASGDITVDYDNADFLNTHIAHPTSIEGLYVEYPIKDKTAEDYNDVANYKAKPRIFVDGFRHLQ